MYSAAMNPSLRSWIVPAIAVALVIAAVLYASAGLDEDNFRAFIRLTAGSSVVLFALAWSASSLNTLLPNGQWRGVLAARRRIGIAFAVSHSFHLAGIIAMYEIARGGDCTALVAWCCGLHLPIAIRGKFLSTVLFSTTCWQAFAILWQ